MISLNERAAKIVRRMIDDAEVLGLSVAKFSNGAIVVDAGVNSVGSLEAGRLFAEACLGGLGHVSLCDLEFDGLTLPGVSVAVKQTPIACMAAQYAGWALNMEGDAKTASYHAMGSGPARALYRGEPLFEMIDWQEQAEVAVLALESRELPGEHITEWIAGKCHVSPARLFLMVAPTASLVGSVQVAARVVETGLHKMIELGFDIRAVISGFGTCALAPIAKDDLQAIGRTNDGVLYSGRSWYTVRTDDAKIQRLIENLPSSASREYGTPFYEILQRHEGDFYKVDPLLFGPAEVSMNNLATGRTFHAGRIDVDIIRRMLLQ